MNEEKKYFLEIDDFGLLMPGFDDLLRLKKHWEGFKMTCFTIPFPKEFFIPENREHFRRKKYRQWADIVNAMDWIEIGIHGFFHEYYEFDNKYQDVEEKIIAAENLFEEVGLKYKKIFRAPYWQYSYDALCMLRDRGYTIAIDRNNLILLPNGARAYIYNWSFEEELPNADWIFGHGHLFSTGRVKNALSDCYGNITKSIPENANFGFISEIPEKYIWTSEKIDQWIQQNSPKRK